MTERPILFDGESVRGILAGIKTQTRRVVTLPDASPADSIAKAATKYRVGDRLWVRETWAPHPDDSEACVYRATDPGWNDEDTGLRWRPSIFMPRVASRITLEVTGVRVERVQEINEADAIAEGMNNQSGAVYWDPNRNTIIGANAHAFMHRWDGINAKRAPWASNPWVWIVEFVRIDQ